MTNKLKFSLERSKYNTLEIYYVRYHADVDNRGIGN